MAKAIPRPEPVSAPSQKGARPSPGKKPAARRPRYTRAESRKICDRFHAAMPEPKGELHFVNPFTLLVAVVLSPVALLEELDMLDIAQCPKIIVETDNGIDDVNRCGLVYTKKTDLQEVYNSLLDGSESHLRSYVRNIEAIIGKGNYEAQVLPQTEVEIILGR